MNEVLSHGLRQKAYSAQTAIKKKRILKEEYELT